MKYRFLSHILASPLPTYGGQGSVLIDPVKSIQGGDSANVFRITIESHWGTHVDAPYHFFDNGKKITDYPAEFWIFKSPHTIQVDLKPSEVLEYGDWLNTITPGTEILLFQSGWGNRREEKNYCVENPGIHPEVGLYLRENLPSIRMIGIDWISISPYQDRELGREAHRVFLDRKGRNNPVLLIEDMDLSCDLTKLRELWVLPLRVEKIDSAPCTVIGGFI